MAALAVLVLANLGIAFRLGRSINGDAVVLGLCFGQVGLLAVWTFSARIKRRPRWILGSFGLAALSGVLGAKGVMGSPNSTDYAMYVLVFASANAGVLALLGAHRWFWTSVTRGPSSQATWQVPRFGVWHLLLAMPVVAVLGLVVRHALPEIAVFGRIETFLIIGQYAALAALAGVLLLDRPPSWRRFAALAGAGVVAAWLSDALLGFDEAFYSNAIEVAVLALGLLVPQLDRYRLRVYLEPREAEANVPGESQESVTH